MALNARAYREAQSASLRNLLEYVDRGKVGDDPLVRLIAKRVDDANKDRKWVRKVFSGLSAEEDAWMQARIARREGMEKGSGPRPPSFFAERAKPAETCRTCRFVYGCAALAKICRDDVLPCAET